ncbi:hypothetical protein YC2023_099545 [Brassica napus]
MCGSWALGLPFLLQVCLWRVNLYVVRFLYMSFRFNGCTRSQLVGFGGGNLQVCLLNDGIVTWRIALVPSEVVSVGFLGWSVLGFFGLACVRLDVRKL